MSSILFLHPTFIFFLNGFSLLTFANEFIFSIFQTEITEISKVSFNINDIIIIIINYVTKTNV